MATNSKQKKIKLEGVEYTLQKLPAMEALKLRSRCKDKQGNPDEIKLYGELLEHVVVIPKVTIDDFEDVADLEELMVEVIEFQYTKKK